MAAPKKKNTRRSTTKAAPTVAALLRQSIAHHKSAIALHRNLLDAHEALLDGFHDHLAALAGGGAAPQAPDYHPGVHACIARYCGTADFAANTTLQVLGAEPELVRGCVYKKFHKDVPVAWTDTEDRIVQKLETVP